MQQLNAKIWDDRWRARRATHRRLHKSQLQIWEIGQMTERGRDDRAADNVVCRRTVQVVLALNNDVSPKRDQSVLWGYDRPPMGRNTSVENRET